MDKKQKSYDVPRYNSCLRTSALIQKAVEDLAKIPGQVEEAVNKTLENSQVRAELLRKATKKLNLPTSAKVYRDLLDIEKVPEVRLKRISPKEKKPVDPAPVITDYVQPSYSQIKIQSHPIPPAATALLNKKDQFLNKAEIDALNDNFYNPHDLMDYERRFMRGQGDS